jgi:hypothetical protein
MKRVAKVKWEGGNERCPHEHLKDTPVPGNVILYGTPYRKGKDGPLVQGKTFVPKKVRVVCEDCGAVGVL